MTTGIAWSALLLSAKMAGVDPSMLDRPAMPAPQMASEPAPTLVLSLPLAEIAEEQDRSWDTREVGRGAIDFAAAFGSGYENWVKLRQEGQTQAFPIAKFDGGIELNFPTEPYRFVAENGAIRAYPTRGPQEPQAIVPIPGLWKALYNAAKHVLFAPVEYAVMYEDGRTIPDSVSLLREDQQGTFWLTYHRIFELREIDWFLAVNGTMFGMKVREDNLEFYSKPVPPAKEIRFPSSERPFR